MKPKHIKDFLLSEMEIFFVFPIDRYSALW